jgi:general secretion pathway protein H
LVTRANSSQGFTLIELLVVLFVMGLLLTLAVPSFRNVLPGVELKTSTRQVATALREARGQAIAANDDASVTFDLAEVRLRVEGSDWLALRGVERMSVFTAGSETPDETTARIRFFADGSSTGGRVTLDGGNSGYLVAVDWLTGHVNAEPQTQSP